MRPLTRHERARVQELGLGALQKAELQRKILTVDRVLRELTDREKQGDVKLPVEMVARMVRAVYDGNHPK